MSIARPLLKYSRLKTLITTPDGGMSASRITDPTAITLSVGEPVSFRGIAISPAQLNRRSTAAYDGSVVSHEDSLDSLI